MSRMLNRTSIVRARRMSVREWEIGRAAGTVEEIAAETEAEAGVPAAVADAGAGGAGDPEAVGVEAGTGVLGEAAEAEADTKLCHVSCAESTRAATKVAALVLDDKNMHSRRRCRGELIGLSNIEEIR
jgi:hypothetical protein